LESRCNGAKQLTEADFWVRLEFRLYAEFAGQPSRRHRYFWCDGLLPDEYILESPQPRALGTAFLGNSGQDRWRFVLLLHQHVQNVEEIDWAALLPPDGVTCWMYFEERDRYLEIDPSVACPDLL
jgi:hypothetical protein